MIFDLKNNRKSKLLWMNLQKDQNCKFNSALLTIHGKEIKILKRYNK